MEEGKDRGARKGRRRRTATCWRATHWTATSWTAAEESVLESGVLESEVLDSDEDEEKRCAPCVASSLPLCAYVSLCCSFA